MVCINRNILECKGNSSAFSFEPIFVLIETYWNVKTVINTAHAAHIRINRNILECKEHWRDCCPVSALSINRNILECKDRYLHITQSVNYSINRNILECKDLFERNLLRQRRVLIETYWNVKTEKPLLYVYLSLVLIETYWNVKGFLIAEDFIKWTVLIETYWNVKGIECTGITLVVRY